MQKLTYINLDNEQIVFQYAPFVLAKVDGLGLTDMKTETLRGVSQQGDTIAGFTHEARMITATFTLMCATRSAMYEKRMELLRILSPDKAIRGDERAALIYENDYVRYMTYAFPTDGVQAKKRIANAQPSLKVNFRCESPFLFSVNTSSVVFDYSGEGFSLPFSFPIDFGRRDYSKEANNAGHVAAPVVIEIKCEGELPRLYNQTTGKRITLVAAVPAGNTLVLNTDPARLDAKIIDAEGNETGAFGILSLDTPLAEFVLAPGINELVYEAGGASAQSEITIKWRNAYEGV